jgi:hypothetical protein
MTHRAHHYENRVTESKKKQQSVVTESKKITDPNFRFERYSSHKT